MSDKINTFFEELELFGIKLGLEQTRDLFSRIGNPHEKLKFIHIAGTNGKGSVGAMLSAALTKSGHKTGFYSSPHLINICERFRIDGKAISENELAEIIRIVEPHICEMRRNDSSPTYFEVTTAIAATYFAKENVDFVIWETGMGGRFDATNIVSPEISVITGIGIDHSDYLGSTIEEIAFEKAGIIKPGIPVFCGELQEEAQKVIHEKAEEQKSEMFMISSNAEAGVEELEITGEYQKKNARLAIMILSYLADRLDFDLEEAKQSLNSIVWPARLQILKSGTIIDGAHNPQAMKSLIFSLEALFPRRKYKVIFASLKDKDTINVLKILATITEEFIFPEVKSSRGMVSPEDLAEIAAESIGINGRSSNSFSEAYESLGSENVLITGSLYLAGEALKELLDEEKIPDIY